MASQYFRDVGVHVFSQNQSKHLVTAKNLIVGPTRLKNAKIHQVGAACLLQHKKIENLTF